jgi:hypothetical protein
MSARGATLALTAAQQIRCAQGFDIGPVLSKNLNNSGRYKMLLMKIPKPLR